MAWTLRVEQEIVHRKTTLTVGYVGSRGNHQILSEDENTPAYVICPIVACPASLAAGTVHYYTSTKLANPDLATLDPRGFPKGSSNYNGLEVDVRRQFAHGLQLRGVYNLLAKPRRWFGVEHQRLVRIRRLSFRFPQES